MYGVVFVSPTAPRRCIAQAFQGKQLRAQQALLSEKQALSVHGSARVCCAQQLVLWCGGPAKYNVTTIISRIAKLGGQMN